MKLVATIRSTETSEIAVELDDEYETARDALLEQVPEGWQVQSLRRRAE